MGLPIRAARPIRASGFTLIEVVVVLLIFGIVIAMVAAVTRGVAAGQKRSLTATRIAGIDAAMVQFVQQQKRLPCPADGSLLSTNANAGLENPVGGPCIMTDGVVPWRSLGLTESDATDGWERRLTYRPFPALAQVSGMDMSWCDPAGTEGVAPNPILLMPRACSPACSTVSPSTIATCTPPSHFLNGKGLKVMNLASPQVLVMDPDPPANTGAAYVIISPGESGGGGYLSSGVLGVSSVGDGNEEMKNYASLPYAGVATYYVDHSLIEIADATHFDDLVSRPSVMAVISKAGLGPRAH